jgi:hypothetical protein
VVPAKIKTVLLPLGTLEPHGVAPSGNRHSRAAGDSAPRVNSMVAPAIAYGRLPPQLSSMRLPAIANACKLGVWPHRECSKGKA